MLGVSAGYNATQHIAVVGEFQYASQDAEYGNRSNGKLYGGVLRYSFLTGRVAPYVLGGGGGYRQSGGAFGAGLNADGWYAATGAGASVYITHHWGVRPEFRYNWTSLTAGVLSEHGDLYQVGGGVFFQFGRGVENGAGN